MTRYRFDIESDRLLDSITQIHCLVVRDVETGREERFNDQNNGRRSILTGLRLLETADELIGHNILDFDLPAIRLLHPWFNPLGKITDTLVCARVIWPDRFALIATDTRCNIPSPLRGLHSLKAWGYRLGELKGTFSENADSDTVWKVWSQDMEDYCAQDVVVTSKLHSLTCTKGWSQECFELEHEFARLIGLQVRHGFRFDRPGAERLYAELAGIRAELEKELRVIFPPRIETMKTPLYWECILGAGERYQAPTKGELERLLREKGLRGVKPVAGPMKTKEHPFNPASGEQILDRLVEKYQWKPTVWAYKKKVRECLTDKERLAAKTEGYHPAITDEVLSALEYPEAKPLARYLLINKRIGQIAEGDQAWLKLEKKGRIHGRVNTAGAVTGRCTHNNPNVAQVPAVNTGKKDGQKVALLGEDGGWGWECRDRFKADEGWLLVGADASGLELRCLAHFMGRHDGGAYAKVLLEGDIHSENQKAAGLPTRDNAKTFIYAFLYGAGDEKIGRIVGGGAKEGKKLKEKFLRGLPALGLLKAGITHAVKTKGYLIGLDGRRLPVRSAHAALNTLLQSAGALVMKKALCLLYEDLTSHGYAFGRDYAFVANIHDEIQTTCRPEISDEVGKMAVSAIRKAGEHFKFRCPLDGEFKVGRSWAETH